MRKSGDFLAKESRDRQSVQLKPGVAAIILLGGFIVL